MARQQTFADYVDFLNRVKLDHRTMYEWIRSLARKRNAPHCNSAMTLLQTLNIRWEKLDEDELDPDINGKGCARRSSGRPEEGETS